jgi:hypothetical protein
MSKRMRSAWIAVAMLAAGSCIAFAADARTSGLSRSCLTPAAKKLLSQIEQKFGPVRIISTCRPGARIRGTGRPSRHASGNAIDFNAGSKKAAVIQWLIANHRNGGTMTYPNMDHIHVDIGRRFVSLARPSRTAANPSQKWEKRTALGGPQGSGR